MDRAEYLDRNFEDIKRWMWLYRREDLIKEMVEADLWSSALGPLVRGELATLPLSNNKLMQSGNSLLDAMDEAVSYLALSRFYDEQYKEWRSRQ